MHKKGDEVWIHGCVLSVKPKTARDGEPFVGVVLFDQADQDAIYWMRRTPDEQAEAPLARHNPVGIAGYVSGVTDDGKMTFLEDVTLIDPRATDENEQAAEHFEVMEAVRVYNAEYRADQKKERDVKATIELTVDAMPRGGFYTVQMDDDTHRTFRVQAPIEKARNPDFDGWQFIGLLTGPYHTDARSYRTVAYRKANEEVVRIKNGYADDTPLANSLRALLTSDADARHAMGVKWASASGACYVCGRMLTTPESIEAGIGPVCAAR